MNCHPVFRCSGHNHTGNNLELSNLLIKSIALEYMGESLLPVQNRLDDLDNEVSNQKLDTGIIVTAKNGTLPVTQSEKNAQTISMVEYGATGDGTSDDTAAFELLEANVTGQIIDLQDKVYAVKIVPTDNVYRNGYFSIAGIKHPSELDPYALKNIKHCMKFNTGNRWDPNNPVIFGGADNVFQGICIVPQPSGNPKLYVTQRSYREDGITAGDNWLKYETYRIIEYTFKEDGSTVTAVAFSKPLDIGHASGLSYKYDSTGQLWLYSGFPNDSLTDAARGGKGFSRIKWIGSETSNNDITYHQLFDYAETPNAVYPNLNKGGVKLDSTGTRVLIHANNLDKHVGSIVLSYDLEEVLSSSNPTTVQPLTVFQDVNEYGYILQGFSIHNDLLVTYYDAGVDTQNITITTLTGSPVASYDFSLVENFYSKEDLRGRRGVLEASEAEGLVIYANDIYVGQRAHWNSISTTVIYDGKYYAVRKNSKNRTPGIGDNDHLWQEIDAQYAVNPTAWDASVQYESVYADRIHVDKRIYKIGSIDEIGAKPLGLRNELLNNRVSKMEGIRGVYRVEYASPSYQIMPHPSLYYENRVYTELEKNRPVRVVTNGGNNLFKGYGNSIPIIADTSTSVAAIVMSRAGINYSSLYNSAGYTVFAARNGNHLQLNTFADDVGNGSGFWAGVILSGSGEPVKYLAPSTADDTNLGKSSKPFQDAYLKNTPIVSSDERLKQDFRSLKAAEKKAALEIKETICLYKMKDSVVEKGDGARWHVGVKAQQVVSIMKSHGLDPFDYGFICYDEWDALDAEIDEDGNELQTAREAGDKYAIRYDELAMFILAAI